MIPVETFRQIDSTNAEAARRAASGMCGPLWLRADVQTSGRGRSGRSWASDARNLHATLLLPVEDDPARAALHSFVACLAVADTFDALGVEGERVALKWPNDVLIDGRKSAGVLLESGTGKAGRWLAIGIGINLAHAPADTRWPAISVHDVTGRVHPPAEALDILSEAIASHVGRFDREGFAPVRAAWLARAARLGEIVEACLPRETLSGRFETLDEDGAMLLHTDTGIRRIVAADVHFP